MARKDHSEKVVGRVYVAELAYAIDRTQHTIRCWTRDKTLPRALMPRRDERGWRYWTPEQVDLFVEWLETRRPQSAEKLVKLRAPREKREDKEAA